MALRGKESVSHKIPPATNNQVDRDAFNEMIKRACLQSIKFPPTTDLLRLVTSDSLVVKGKGSSIYAFASRQGQTNSSQPTTSVLEIVGPPTLVPDWPNSKIDSFTHFPSSSYEANVCARVLFSAATVKSKGYPGFPLQTPP